MINTVASNVGSPRGIAIGADHNIWFAECFANKIGRITTAGTVTEFSTNIAANGDPNSMTAGPDGNLWFVYQLVSSIGQVTTAGAITEFPGLSSPAFGIVEGPDGNLWIIEQYNKIARLQ